MIQQREKQNLPMQEKEDIRVIAESIFLRKTNGNGIQDSDSETDFHGMENLSCCNKAYLGWKQVSGGLGTGLVQRCRVSESLSVEKRGQDRTAVLRALMTCVFVIV